MKEYSVASLVNSYLSDLEEYLEDYREYYDPVLNE